MSEHIASTLEHLYRLAMENGERKTDVKADRERDGTYVSGYRDDITTATLQHGRYQIKATEDEFQRFNLAADTKGTNFDLEVHEEDKIVLRAHRDGVNTVKRFGPEERYEGTERTEATAWEIKEGEIPSALELVPA